ncbi:hypothetical protein CDEF62S_01884 [Castellaniella defragrans]
MLWVTWKLEPVATGCAALVFSLLLSVPLARAAWWLPRTLDDALPAKPIPAHLTGRRIFLSATALLALACAWRFGPTGATLAAIVFTSVLLVLAWIDAETGFLPDCLTLPLLWLGLLVNMDATFAPLAYAVGGAAGGYLAFWCVDGAFRALTGREALGREISGCWPPWAPGWVGRPCRAHIRGRRSGPGGGAGAADDRLVGAAPSLQFWPFSGSGRHRRFAGA